MRGKKNPQVKKHARRRSCQLRMFSDALHSVTAGRDYSPANKQSAKVSPRYILRSYMMYFFYYLDISQF